MNGLDQPKLQQRAILVSEGQDYAQEDRGHTVGNIRVAEGLLRIQTQVLSDCGHLPHVEMPGVFNELALVLLRSIS